MSKSSKTFEQLGLFGSSGVVAMALNLLVTTTAHEAAGLSVGASYGLGFSVVLVVSFMLCRHKVFDAATQAIRPQFTRFVISSLFFRGAEYASCYLIFKVLGIHYFVSLVAVQITSFFIKFFFYRAVVFSGDDKAST